MKKVYVPLSSFRQCASSKLYNTSSFLILCHIALWVSFLEQARYFYNYSIRQIGLLRPIQWDKFIIFSDQNTIHLGMSTRYVLHKYNV